MVSPPGGGPWMIRLVMASPIDGRQKLEAGSLKLESRSQSWKPEARSQRHAGSRNPEARSQKLEAGGRKPEARSQKPEAGLARGAAPATV